VERSDTHQLELLLSDGFREGLNPSYGLHFAEAMGFAGLNPSYELLG
jgi:hypothetical protein